jgi:hypothetical protein
LNDLLMLKWIVSSTTWVRWGRRKKKKVVKFQQNLMLGSALPRYCRVRYISNYFEKWMWTTRK